MRLKQRVTVISGATGGLGRVAAQAFAKEGAYLVLLGRNEKKLEALAKDLNLSAQQSLILAVDVSDSKAVSETAEAILEKFGRIEILLNLVGGWIGGKALIETDVEDIENMIQQHVRSTFLLIKAFVPHMLNGQWGRVLTISSPSASRPPGNNAPYAIGKAGMEAMMLSLAQEVQGSGVTANMLLVNTIDIKHERKQKPSPINQIWTTPEEISATLLHLSSGEAGMINGARIPLYGSP